MPSLIHKILLEHHEKVIEGIFARKANKKFFNDFCKIQAQNVKAFAEGFKRRIQR